MDSLSQEGKRKPEKSIINISFAFEKYSIDYRKKILIEVNNASEDEKLKKLREMVLVNNFQRRRVKDLGFLCFVYNEILNDKSVYFRMKKLMTRIIGELLEEPRTIINQKRKGDTHIENKLPYSSKGFFDISNIQNQWSTQEFLHYQLKQSLEKNDLHENQAILSFFNDYSIGLFGGYQVLKSQRVFEGSQSNAYYYNYSIKYAIQEINYFDIYQNNFHPQLSALITYNNQEIFNDIISLLETIIPNIRENILQFNKFINDLQSIISIEWFLEYSNEEKINILNKEYDLRNLNMYLKNEVLLLSNSNDLQNFMNSVLQLKKNGYHYDLLRILNAIIDERFIQNQYGFLLHDSIATIYRELGNHEEALKHYLLAKNLPKSSNTEKDQYLSVINLIRIGEEFYKLGKLKDSENYLNQAKINVSTVSNNLRSFIYSNFAGFYSRIFDFQKEREYLRTSIHSFKQNHPSYDKQRKRLLHIDEIFNTDTNPEYALKKQAIDEEITKFFSWGSISLLSFYFDNSIKHFNHLLSSFEKKELDEVLEDLSLNLAQAYFFSKDLKNANTFFTDVLRINNKNSTALAYLGCIELLHSKKKYTYFIENRSFEEEIIEAYLEEFVRTIAQFVSPEEIEEALIIFSEKFESRRKKNICFKIGLLLSELGFLNLSVDFLESSLNLCFNRTDKSELNTNLGKVYAKKDEHLEAIELYNKAIEEDETNYIAYYLKGKSYASILDYNHAIICLNNSINIVSKNKHNKISLEELKKELSIFERLKSTTFNINKIPKGSKIRDSLITGDKIYYFLTDKDIQLNDASAIIQAYSKSYELMLQMELTLPFIDYLKGIYGSHIPKDIEKKSRSKFLRSFHDSSQTVTLGQMFHIVRKLTRTQDPINLHFRDFLKEMNLIESIDLLRDTCYHLKDLRNPLSHHEIISFEEVELKRSEIVEKINKVIELLY